MMRLPVRDRLLGTAFLAISLLNIPCGRMAAQIQPSPDLAAASSLTSEVAKRVPFIVAPSFRVAEVPSSVLARDLNGDGKVDLVVASAATEQISVYMGLGQGKFSEPVVYNVGGHPVFVATADILGNGEDDIVTANGTDGTVSVLAGVGGGKFAAAHVYSTGVSADLLSLGDLSGSGKQDLVVASLTGKAFSVMLNDGHGSLQSPAIHTLTSMPTALSMSDFNNDRRADVAFAHGDGTVTLLLGEGSGTFGSTKTFSVSSNKLSSLVSGDFNRDGKVDLAVVQSDGHVVSIFSGQGDGTFVRGASYQTGNGPISASTVDLRGNGLVDLVTVNRASNTFSVLMGNGDGTFKEALSFNAGDGPVGVAPGDFEGSGFTGLAIINASAKTVSVVAGSGDGSFKAARSYASDLSPRSIASGDLNGDGRPDLLVANFCGSDAACLKGSTITTFLSTASGGYRAASSRLVGSGVDTVALIDLNGDKILDAVVLSRTDKTVSVLLGKGDGTFRDPLVTSLPEVPVAMAAGDLNGDGKTDLVIATDCGSSPCSQRGTLRLLLGSADGNFQPGQAYPIGFSPVSIAVGALGKSGSLDLVVANRCGADATCKSVGSATVLAGDGKGGFTASADMALGSNLSSVALADLRGLGVLDLVVSQEGESSIAVMRGSGDGSFQSPATYAVGNSPRSAVIADFDGDGYPDIAVSNFGDSTVGVLFGKGDGTFQTASSYAVGTGPESMTVVGSDGRAASLITANGNSGVATLGADITELANIHPQVTLPPPTVVITNLTTSPFVYGTLLPTLSVTVTGGTGSPQPDGTVTFSDSANSGSPVALCTTGPLAAGSSANQGTASCSTSAVLAGGSHSITAQYTAGASGNYSNASSQSPLSQPVSAFTPAASVATTPSTPTSPQSYGTSLSFTATVTGVTTSGAAQPTGTVQFTDGVSGSPLSCTNGSAGTVTLTTSATNSTAICTTAALSGGGHHIFATYMPATADKNYLQQESPSPGPLFTVNPTMPTVTVTSTPATQQYFATQVTFKATVTGTFATGTVGTVQPTGTVAFSENGTDIGCGPVTLTQGTTNSTGLCPRSTLSLGDHTITATYTPAVSPVDTNYATNSGTETPPFKVISIPTSATLSPVSNSSPSNAFKPNQTTIFTATVATTSAAVTAGSPQPGATDGTVTFQLSINGGVATTPCLSVALVAGSAGAGATASCSINGLSVGSDAITATYNPASNNHFGAATPVTSNQIVVKGPLGVTIDTPQSATVNGKPTLTATVSVNSNAPTPLGGTVNFAAQFGTTLLCSASLSAAPAFTTTGNSKSTQVTCTLTSPLTLAANPSLGYPITATYDGTNDINYSGGTGNGTLVVGRATPTVSIGPASISGVINQSLTFTATIAPNATGQFSPTKGNVIFTANGTTQLCSLPVAPTVQCTVNSLPVTLPSGQPNTVVAKYDGQGDPNFALASSTVPASAAISPGPTQTTLSSSSTNNQSTVNESVTFTAKVLQTPVVGVTLGSTFAPIGSVTFSAVNEATPTTLCSAVPFPATSGGATICAVPVGLALGSNAVTATFTPAMTNGNFITSASTVTQTVVAAGTVVSAPSSSKPSSIVDDAVTFSTTVTGNPAGKTAPTLGTVQFSAIFTSPGGTAQPSALLCTGMFTSTNQTTNTSTFTCPALNRLLAGSYSVKAQYVQGAGDSFTTGSSVGSSQVVAAAPVSLTIVSSKPVSEIANQPITFTSTVTPATGSVPLNGTVTFTVAGGDKSSPAVCVPQPITSAANANTASCTITFPTNASTAQFAVTASYSDSNYVAAPMRFSQVVQDFALAPVTNDALPGAPAAGSTTVVYVTPGYTVGGGTGLDPFFASPSVMATAYSGYSRKVSFHCAVVSTTSAGLTCADPGDTTLASTSGNSAQTNVSYPVSAAVSAGAGDYIYNVTGTDTGTPPLSSALVRSSANFTVRVIPLNSVFAINQTTLTATPVQFQVPDGSINHNFTFKCISISAGGKTATDFPKDFACTPPSTNTVQAGGKASFTVGNGGTPTGSLTPAFGTKITVFNAATLGLPSFGLFIFLVRRNGSRRKLYRLFAFIVFAATLSQMIGCGNGGFNPPSTSGVSAPIPVGNYQILVSATDTTTETTKNDGVVINDVYYSVIQMNVVAQ